MTVMLTGATGLLGRALMAELADMDIVGVARTRFGAGILQLDLLQPSEVQRVVAAVRPSVIVHAAAERRPERIDDLSGDAYRLNVDGTRSLASAAAVCSAWILYISSDAVFDGSNPPYHPGDEPNPVNLYGRSKLEAERALRDIQTDCGILRLPLLYGPVRSLIESSVTEVASHLLSGKPVVFDDSAQRYPTHVADVAAICRQLIERRLSGLRVAGAWHWSGGDRLTKAGMAEIIADAMGIPANRVVRSNRMNVVARPLDARLDCSDIERDYKWRRTPFQSAISSILEPFIPGVRK